MDKLLQIVIVHHCKPAQGPSNKIKQPQGSKASRTICRTCGGRNVLQQGLVSSEVTLKMKKEREQMRRREIKRVGKYVYLYKIHEMQRVVVEIYLYSLSF